MYVEVPVRTALCHIEVNTRHARIHSIVNAYWAFLACFDCTQFFCLFVCFCTCVIDTRIIGSETVPLVSQNYRQMTIGCLQSIRNAYPLPRRSGFEGITSPLVLSIKRDCDSKALFCFRHELMGNASLQNKRSDHPQPIKTIPYPRNSK